MTSASAYEEQIKATLKTLVDENGEKTLRWDSPQEARLYRSQIVQLQRELRLIKRDINSTIGIINTSYQSEMALTGKGLGSSILAGILGRKAVGRVNVLTRNSLRRKQLDSVEPYRTLIRWIDKVIMQFEQVKVEMDGKLLVRHTED